MNRERERARERYRDRERARERESKIERKRESDIESFAGTFKNVLLMRRTVSQTKKQPTRNKMRKDKLSRE